MEKKKKEKMALSDLPDVLGMEERGASSNSGGVSVESYKERDLLKRRKCGPATVRIMDTVDVFK